MTKTIKWAAARNGDFDTGSDWIGGAEPTSKNIAYLRSFDGQPYTVTVGAPVEVTGLNIGLGVDVEVNYNLVVTAQKSGAKPGGQITNDGTIDISARLAAIAFTTTFTNDGVLEIANDGGVVGDTKGAIFINNGKILLNKNDNSNISGVSEVDNAGVISGSGGITSNILNTGTIAGGYEPRYSFGLALYKVQNDGVMEVLNGDTITALDAVSGHGYALIDGGTLDFKSAFDQAVTFTGSGTLELARSQAFTSILTGFSTTGATTLDLGDVRFVKADEATFSGTVSGGVLTVIAGTHVARINLVGDYTNATFIASDDGADGTYVIAESTQTPRVAHFIGAMAAITGHGGSARLIDACSVHEGRQMMLAAPRLAIA